VNRIRSIPVTAAIGVEADSDATVAMPLLASNAVAAATEPEANASLNCPAAGDASAPEPCAADAPALEGGAAEPAVGAFGALVRA
jgi:hypothetical protein